MPSGVDDGREVIADILPPVDKHPWGVEFTAFFASAVSKELDQIFISRP